jgi:hypothetical protein
VAVLWHLRIKKKAMPNTMLTKPNPLKKAYTVVDSVMQEVILAEEETLKVICSKLQEENLATKNPIIDKIIEILKDWGKVSVSELRARASGL